MLSYKLMGGSLAAIVGAGAMLASVTTSQAAMLHVPHHAAGQVHNIDCLLGAHVGPLGGCIGDDNDRHDPAIERRAADAPGATKEKTITHDENGCSTKTVKETDGMGNSEARSKTNC
jgi:hypothetical protein